jgi:hypothetical protein
MPDIPPAQNGADDKQRKKERERVDKWMKMMKVVKRDQGGNILQWGWRMDGQGAKVCSLAIMMDNSLICSYRNECTREYPIDGEWQLGGLLQKSTLIRKPKGKARGKRNPKTWLPITEYVKTHSGPILVHKIELIYRTR